MLRAGLASADFIFQNIPLHLHRSGTQLRKEALERAPSGGLFLEFGVFRGDWLRYMSRIKADERFFGFDSFEGLPEPWSDKAEGHFDLGGKLPDVPENVTLVKGWFNETLEGFLQEHHDYVSFIHMDCDLYSATSYVLETIKSRLVVGTVIVLDDYLIEPGWEREEHRAFHEFVDRYGLTFEYLGYGDMAASTVITGLGSLGDT